MVATMKSLEIAKDVQEELNLRLGLTGATTLLSSTLTYEALPASVSDATTLYPVLLIGDGTATHATCRIAFKQIETYGTDGIGLTQNRYTPHEILWGLEAVSGAGAEPLSLAQKATIAAVLAARGCRLSVFSVATGNAFTTASFTSGNKLTTIEPSVKYPTSGQ